MSLVFHPPLDQIEANQFGQVTASNRRMLRILKNLGQDGDDYEIYYQPCIGDDRPDFAVVRRYRGIQLIKTCELNLSGLKVRTNGSYDRRLRLCRS